MKILYDELEFSDGKLLEDYAVNVLVENVFDQADQKGVLKDSSTGMNPLKNN